MKSIDKKKKTSVSQEEKTIAPKAKKSAKKQVVDNNISRDERIRQRAHELFVQRNGQNGNPEEDWLRAEEEIGS